MIRTRKQLKTKKKKIEKTNKVLKIKEKLQNNFKNANQREINNEIRKEKAFEPIVKALRDIENAVNKIDADSQKALIPLKTSTLIDQSSDGQKRLFDTTDYYSVFITYYRLLFD
jgi:hypothetical protein